MANVPDVTGPTVAPNAIQPLQNISATPGAFGEHIAEGLGAVAKAGSQTAEMLDQHAQVMQGLANKAAVDNASITTDDLNNKVFTDFTTTKLGANALPALPGAIADMTKNRTEQRAALTNPTAQAAFDASTLRTQKAFEGEMYRHASAQQNSYVKTSSVNAMESAGNLIVANPNNTELEAGFLQTIKTQSNFLAKHEGLDGPDSSENADKMALEQQGKVFSEAAKNIAVTSPPEAMAYLAAHEKLMDPLSFTRTQTALRPSVMANDAADVATRAVGMALGTSGAAPTIADPKGYFSHLVGADVQISSGARTPEHNAAVGGVPNSEHIPANGTAFDIVPPAGMTTASLAATLKSQIPDAHQIIDEGDHVHVGWRKGAQIGPATSADLQDQMEHTLKLADSYAEAKYPGNAVFRDQVEARAQAALNRRIGAAKDTETAAYTDLGSQILTNGIQDLHTLLSQPGALDRFNSLPLASRTALQMDMKRNASEITPERFQNITLLNGMYAARAENPEAFLNAPVATMDLPLAQRLQFLKQQDQVRNKPGSVDPNGKFIQQVTKSPEFQSTLAALNIKPKEKGIGTDDYYHLVGSVQAEKEAWDASNAGKQPSQKDVLGMLARATAEQHFHNTFAGVPVPFSGSSSRAFDVSDEDRALITKSLQTSGLPVNELNIAHAARLGYIAQGRRNAAK